MIDPEPLLQIINDALRLSATEIDSARLAGDASNRTYHRVSWRGNGASGSLILMVLAEPEGFKGSEEAVSGALLPVAELPFVNIQRHLWACKAPVPEIVFYDQKRGWLLLEDLGDVTLAEAVRNKRGEALIGYYETAIDELLTLQLEATAPPSPPTIAHHRFFDQALFVWEFDHFIEYGIEKRKGIEIPEKEKSAIRSYFSDIALRLASLPQVFTHRDYHSRNLMIQSDAAHAAHAVSHPVSHPANLSGFKIRIIDFQDALMGPCQYDLASLLRDSYVDLPEEAIDRLIAYYL
ncbi:MAG TPA: phosphotransferase, partial [Candidatus Manganitrophaceae bacterium]|nr:phosphotransferase [Candidatus Manganitrophaceae bacterium]